MTHNDVYIGKFRKTDDAFDTISCVICCEEFDNDSKIIKLNCDHIYHMNCFIEYKDVQSNNSGKVKCAICRQELTDYILEKIDNLYQIYCVDDEGYMSDNQLELTDTELQLNMSLGTGTHSKSQSQSQSYSQYIPIPQCLGCYKEISEIAEAIQLKCCHKYHWDCLESHVKKNKRAECICGTPFNPKLMPIPEPINSSALIVPMSRLTMNNGTTLNANVANNVNVMKENKNEWNNLFSSLRESINVS